MSAGINSDLKCEKIFFKYLTFRGFFMIILFYKNDVVFFIRGFVVRNRKAWIMIGLLVVNSDLFCDIDRSINKATRNLYYATVAVVGAAIAIGISSYVVDMLLCRFEATKNMENRELIATGSCASLYAILLISAEYQRNVEQPEEAPKRDHVVEEQDLIDESQLEEDSQAEGEDN